MKRLLTMLCPSECVQAVHEIDLVVLQERGIRAVLLDLDNTLVPWHGYDLPPGVGRWLESLKNHGMTACLVSNTRFPKRLRRLSAELGLPFTTKGMKPHRSCFRQALQMLGVDSSEAVMIGDQVFTDIFGGNRSGLYTILVFPIHKKEFIGTKVSRFFEKYVLKLLFRRGLIQLPDSKTKFPGEQSAHSDSQK